MILIEVFLNMLKGDFNKKIAKASKIMNDSEYILQILLGCSFF